MLMFSSTIIPTINRSTLSRTVDSVLAQDLTAADFEVIVVNDSGQPLPDMDWRRSERVRVLDTHRRERCVARNAGAAIARGKYLHFLDDDDLLLPGALEAFWNLDRENSDAVWLYGSYQTVNNEGEVVEEWRPGIQGKLFALLVSGEGIPFQASLLRADTFHTVGAFDPSPAILGVEDRDVGRRMALAGAVAYTPAVVAKIRIGEEGSSTNWATLAEGDRYGREKALAIENAFVHLRVSADSDYWRGRVCRAYLGSTVWNLRRKSLFKATSRAVAGLAIAGWHVLSPEFWNGLKYKIR
jgi:glycosyltransferase involved in cell wall biosynthesis